MTISLPPHEMTFLEYFWDSKRLSGVQKDYQSTVEEVRKRLIGDSNGDANCLSDRGLEHLCRDWISLPQRLTDPEGIYFERSKPEHSSVIVAREVGSGKPIGIDKGCPTTLPGFRGKGIGGRLVAERDLLGCRANPWGTFTPEGFRGRLSAHALHVSWAIQDGKRVPEYVLEEYRCVGGRLRLLEGMQLGAANELSLERALAVRDIQRPSRPIHPLRSQQDEKPSWTPPVISPEAPSGSGILHLLRDLFRKGGRT